MTAQSATVANTLPDGIRKRVNGSVGMSSSLSSWSTAPMGAGRLLQDARWGVAGFLPAARGCKILVLATGAPLRARSQRPTFLRREDASPVGASAPGATQQHSFGKEWHTPESDACAITTPFLLLGGRVVMAACHGLGYHRLVVNGFPFSIPPRGHTASKPPKVSPFRV